jgi:hypothetical protein
MEVESSDIPTSFIESIAPRHFHQKANLSRVCEHIFRSQYSGLGPFELTIENKLESESRYRKSENHQRHFFY